MSPRAAITVFFALDGFAVASFFARLPSIQDRLELSNGRIGLALLALTVTLLVAQPPLVGFLAEATSLRLALAAVLGLLCLTAAGLASTAR